VRAARGGRVADDGGVPIHLSGGMADAGVRMGDCARKSTCFPDALVTQAP
jgi:hypothetical protein